MLPTSNQSSAYMEVKEVKSLIDADPDAKQVISERGPFASDVSVTPPSPAITTVTPVCILIVAVPSVLPIIPTPPPGILSLSVVIINSLV